MRLRLLTITHKTPAWLETGVQDYLKRLPPPYNLEIITIAAEKRTATSNLTKIMEQESAKMLSHVKPQDKVIALDVKGKAWSTEDLAAKLAAWQTEGQTINFLVGGPEGLTKTCKARANETWSLSALTFPHIFIKLLVAEQMYRAYSILTNHPYHK